MKNLKTAVFLLMLIGFGAPLLLYQNDSAEQFNQAIAAIDPEINSVAGSIEL